MKEKHFSIKDELLSREEEKALLAILPIDQRLQYLEERVGDLEDIISNYIIIFNLLDKKLQEFSNEVSLRKKG